MATTATVDATLVPIDEGTGVEDIVRDMESVSAKINAQTTELAKSSMKAKGGLGMDAATQWLEQTTMREAQGDCEQAAERGTSALQEW